MVQIIVHGVGPDAGRVFNGKYL